MKKSMIFLAMFLAAHTGLFAQMNVESNWKVKTEEPVKWLKVTPSGYIVAGSDNGLCGINPATGTVAWKTAGIANLKEENFENIAGSPLFLIKESKTEAIRIIHSVTGAVLYNTASDGFTKLFRNSFFIPIGGILIDGQIGDTHAITLIDMDSGKQKWIKKFTGEKTGGMFAKITVVAKPILDNDNNLLYSSKEKLYRINSNTGDVIWEKPFDKKVGAVYVTPDNSQVIVITGSLSNSQKQEQAERSSMVVSSAGNTGTFFIDLLKMADGSPVWKESLKYKSKFSGVMLGEKDFFLFHYSGCNIIDYATGKSKWSNDAKAGGDEVINVASNDKGYLITTAYNPTGTYFRYVDFQGNSLWKKEPQTAYGVKEVRTNDKGVFYLSPAGANVLDINTGKFTWTYDKNIDFQPDKGLVLSYDKATDSYAVYNNGKLYVFDLGKIDNKLLIKGISFKGNEQPEKIEKRANGYLLSSGQNLMLVDFSGNIVYQDYFEAPGLGLGAQLGLGLLGAVAEADAELNKNNATIAGGFASITNDPGMRSLANDYSRRAATASDISSGAYALMNTRFKASASMQDHMLLMARTADGIGLLKVDKESGKCTQQVVLNTKKPVFVVDPIDNKLFLVSGDQEISCFEFKN